MILEDYYTFRNYKTEKPIRRKRLFTEPANKFVQDMAAALEEVIEEVLEEETLASRYVDNLETFESNTFLSVDCSPPIECPDFDDMVNEISRLLKKALNLSNKIRWKALSKTDGHYIHNDFFKLRNNISKALYPCIHRIKNVHIPSL